MNGAHWSLNGEVTPARSGESGKVVASLIKLLAVDLGTTDTVKPRTWGGAL